MDKEEGLFDRGGFAGPEKLIRYLSFSKLMNFLVNRALYLSRIDRFPDSLEGRFTLQDRAYLQDAKSGVDLNNWNEYRKLVYASCWTEFDRESDAQWRRYDDCVAIVTRASKLETAMSQWSPGWPKATYCLGRVRYVNPTDAIASEHDESGRRKNILRFATLKDASFRWEEEVRLVVFPRNGSWGADEWPNGLEVPIALDAFVENIIVGPDCESWLLPTLSACAAPYGLGDRVVGSELSVLRSAWK